MELDFKTVKALSSPTRIRILSQVLEGEETPTSLSNGIGKSKSTVSAHLDTLLDAGLVEKDEEEGRRRVVYTPTPKARHIVNGRERKVKFSLASSVVTTLAGFALLGTQLVPSFGYQSMEDQASALSTEMEAAGEATMAAGESGIADASTAILLLGVGFLAFSAAGFMYALLMKRLG